MSDFFTVSVLLATVASGIRLATPFLLAALGEDPGPAERGAEPGRGRGDAPGRLRGLLRHPPHRQACCSEIVVGLAVGGVMGIVYGVVTLALKAEQGISGIGIFIFGLGLSDLLFQKQVGTPTPIDGLSDLALPVLGDLPWVGGGAVPPERAGLRGRFVLVPVMWFVINRTPFGMNVRAVGETPEAADSLGVSVDRTPLHHHLRGQTPWPGWPGRLSPSSSGSSSRT